MSVTVRDALLTENERDSLYHWVQPEWFMLHKEHLTCTIESASLKNLQHKWSSSPSTTDTLDHPPMRYM